MSRPNNAGKVPVRLPLSTVAPLRALSYRLFVALGLIIGIIGVVYVDRDGYHDSQGGSLSLLDTAYYTVVSLSTTGYGDIVPATPTARFVNVFVVTPARILFLIILVGTTLEVLTDQFRSTVRLNRWRKTMRDHYVICGYGTKGRSAIRALLDNGTAAQQIVVVEPKGAIAAQAATDGFAVVEGDATRSSVLKQAGLATAKALVVATDSDDSAVLITLTARQLVGPSMRIVAAAREMENAPLLKQSGAHQVVISSATAGQLLGLATNAPPIVSVIEDLLTPGEGMAIAVRSATRSELGQSPRSLDEIVIALVRRGQIQHLDDTESRELQAGDLVVYIRDDRSTSPTSQSSNPLTP